MTLPQVRLIALDIDGTLVDDRQQVPAANRRALRAAREAGVEVAIASGRMVSSIALVEEAIGFDCCLIAYNGGKVVGRRADGRPLVSHRPLAADVARELIDYCLREGHPLNFYHDERLFCDRAHSGSPLTAVYGRRTGARFEYVDIRSCLGETPTKLILLAEPAQRDRLYEKFAVDLAERSHVLCTEPEYLEFMAPGVDKAAALPELATYVGCGVENVLAVGDGDNDAQMLLRAGVGVAVANARASARAAAPFCTRRTNSEGAVAEAVERWVLGEERPDFWS
jgi:hypothetical protein